MVRSPFPRVQERGLQRLDYSGRPVDDEVMPSVIRHLGSPDKVVRDRAWRLFWRGGYDYGLVKRTLSDSDLCRAAVSNLVNAWDSNDVNLKDRLTFLTRQRCVEIDEWLWTRLDAKKEFDWPSRPRLMLPWLEGQQTPEDTARLLELVKTYEFLPSYTLPLMRLLSRRPLNVEQKSVILHALFAISDVDMRRLNESARESEDFRRRITTSSLVFPDLFPEVMSADAEVRAILKGILEAAPPLSATQVLQQVNDSDLPWKGLPPAFLIAAPMVTMNVDGTDPGLLARTAEVASACRKGRDLAFLYRWISPQGFTKLSLDWRRYLNGRLYLAHADHLILQALDEESLQTLPIKLGTALKATDDSVAKLLASALAGSTGSGADLNALLKELQRQLEAIRPHRPAISTSLGKASALFAGLETEALKQSGMSAQLGPRGLTSRFLLSLLLQEMQNGKVDPGAVGPGDFLYLEDVISRIK